jgi:signal transduction histidine kinase
VRDRIDRKIMEQIHPKDLFYQILDGIRSLTFYDHSSALLIREENEASLRLVAEQIAWTKAKSERIGLRIPITDEAAVLVQSGQAYGFDRHGDSWREWTGRPAAALAVLLDYNSDQAAAGENVREASMLCAPLVTRDGLVGVLKIAARYPGQLKPFDAELAEHFRSQAAIAIQNLHRTESLRARVLTAERKHAMADLARSVSHDVNNALGSMLPLIQQMQADLRRGALAANVFAEDLEQVQKSLQVCRRIFGGMLTFSRNAARRSGFGQIRRAIDTTSAILKYGMSRSAIELQVHAPDEIPEVACSQSDLEQLFLNLLTNAREATPRGGKVVVTVRAADDQVEISIADTGCGISEENLPRVLEPFFTTKSHGNGLGLSICRSVLWEVDGTLSIQSAPGTGTDVRVLIPQAASLQFTQVS